MGREQTLERAERRAPFLPLEHFGRLPLEGRAQLELRVAELTSALAEEQAARELLGRRLSTLLEALPAGVVVLDAQGRVATANPGAVDLLGPLAPGEAWRDIVARAFAPRWDDGHDVSLVDGRRVNVATQALGEEPGQILMITDVSETRRLQEQLSHHRRLSAKTEMAAALAHQIRTPLSAALLALGPLARDRELPAPHLRHAGRALDSLRQLERLVEDMLSFARGAVIDAVPIALPSLRERLAADIAAQARGDGFEVLFDGAWDGLELDGNLDALISIMLNLVGNAREITGGHGRLVVACRRFGDYVALRFTDDGPGVPVQDQARIFEPFFTTRGGGTGLGLSVAQAIARAHGGDLRLDPEHCGGACFELSLPLRRAAATVCMPALPED
jgi:two-component system sensor histidine kinase FlrB